MPRGLTKSILEYQDGLRIGIHNCYRLTQDNATNVIDVYYAMLTVRHQINPGVYLPCEPHCMEFVGYSSMLAMLAMYIFIFTKPSARAGCDRRSIFKRSLTGLNSEFSFS